MVLALHESADDALTELPVAQADSLVFIVGPEGGIADDEIGALDGSRGDSGAARADGAANVDRRGGRAGRLGRADAERWDA